MFQNIQMLRAVAALMVFFFHAGPQYQAMSGAWTGFEKLTRFGFSGVDVFFVISGFVAALTTLHKPRTAQNGFDFLRRRFLRIYLGYWPLFALALLLFWWRPYKPANEIDWLASFFLTSTDMPRLLLYVSWSLSYELLFYLLATLTFVLPARLVVAAVHVAVVVLAWALILKWGQPLSTRWMFASYLLEFLVGVLLFVHRAWITGRWWVSASALGLVAAYGAGAHWSATDGSLRLFTFGSGAVCAVSLALALEQSRIWQVGRMWTALGDSSYALYLLHPSWFVLFGNGVGAAIAAQSPVLRELGFGLFLVAGVAAAHGWYLGIEHPLYRWGLKRLALRPPSH